MEEFLNGKFEEAQKEGLLEKENEVVFENVKEVSSECKFVREIAIDANPEFLEKTHGCIDSRLDGSSRSDEEVAEVKEKNLIVEDPGILKEGGEVTNAVVESAERIVSLKEELTASGQASVEKSGDSDSCMTEVETKEIKEKILPSSTETVTDVVSNGVEETPSLLPSDEIDGVISGGVSIGNEEIKLPSFGEKDGLSSGSMDVMSKGIEEKALPSLDENFGAPPALTDVVAKGIEDAQAIALKQNTGESSQIGCKESVENIDDSSKPLANATVIGSSDGVHESTGNPPIVSLSQRHQPTSWRSCCGLFEVLRSSNR